MPVPTEDLQALINQGVTLFYLWIVKKLREQCQELRK